jgi:alpha-ribazole phosphatase
MLIFDYWRHPECEINLNPGLIGGRSNNSPLTGVGRSQALKLAKRVDSLDEPYDIIFTSPAVRTKEMARVICHQIGYELEDIVIDDRLQELDQGEWEGGKKQEVYTRKQLAIINSNNLHFQPPGGESQLQVAFRMKEHIDECIETYAGKSKRFGICGHGMAIKCLFQIELGFSPTITYKMSLENTAWSTLVHEESMTYMTTFNDSGHLYQAHSTTCNKLF